MSVCEVFSRALPEYLAIGMPYDLFWKGDVWAAKAYREAHRIRRDQANFDAYLGATYVYDAILRLTPVLNAFSKNPKPEPWLEEPYKLSLSTSTGDRDGNISDGKTTAKGEDAGVNFMLQYMSAHNATRSRETEQEEVSPEM